MTHYKLCLNEKATFQKNPLKSRKIILKKFFSRGKSDLFPGLPFVKWNYACKSQIPGAPSLWIKPCGY